MDTISNLGWRVGIGYAKNRFLARIPVPVDKKPDQHFEIPVTVNTNRNCILKIPVPLEKNRMMFIW